MADPVAMPGSVFSLVYAIGSLFDSEKHGPEIFDQRIYFSNFSDEKKQLIVKFRRFIKIFFFSDSIRNYNRFRRIKKIVA